MAGVQYRPQSGFMQWMESRLPLVGFVYSAVGKGYPTPRNLTYLWNFGFLAGVCLVVQIATGIVLAMHYVPDATMAFQSVEHIMRNVNYGWLLRYVHANGASMFFIVVYIHIFRGLYYGSYKAPREVLWMLGVVILLLMMATAFMGYVLPWGQMSFWGATVITGLFSAIPVVGEQIQTLLLGGFSVGDPALNRFFSLHYLLPFVILGVVILHVWALHIPGSNNPLGIDVKGPQDQIPFHPYYTVKDGLGIVVFFMFFALFVFFAPNSLGHPDNYIPADPLVTPPHIVPEWYFLPFYAILRSITFDIAIPFTGITLMSAKLLGVLAMFASILILFALPWLDRSPVRSCKFRPVYRIFFWVLMVDCVLLTYVGGMPAEGIWPTLALIGTIYYFFHFLVLLPFILPRIEKPEPLPNSIFEAVMEGKSGPSTPQAAPAE
ncbi:ubiquinol-cytochrome c reductase cytochrome b subunit [Rhodothalassium salexigens DSM 2132]|uniref:Cytochrome b n=1 Tax=Rhodothalassium salexigens DSM 2132 TaxID=1188247 RepID=A0A4R2PSR0_RHOSA|nr:cytochrome b/b6 [Rhodothalassium salexigens]MBB4210445.1 quinol-cytochrome oxidoreductase complex cytochrome b subunit [Rhodothalassium salexigens DSM 2132]MBK1638231.1 cytochrome b [Rhodothalassium salexigens DSM 2132]TCP37998.1 ubiquinol-cytochrome c reductase cytochrome b subunit [Rhodothalassium salexigens DSM 2132]